MKKSIGFVSLAALALTTASAAYPEEPVNDVRCLVLMAVVQESNSPSVQSGGMMAMLYFMGKVFGATPDIDLETAISGEVEAIREAGQPAIDELTNRCAEDLTRSGRRIKEAGGALSELKAKADD